MRHRAPHAPDRARLGFFQAKLKLLGIELLGPCAKRCRMKALMIDCSRSISASASPNIAVVAGLRSCHRNLPYIHSLPKAETGRLRTARLTDAFSKS